MEKAEFEKRYISCKSALERFVYYKMPNKSDGEDILQDVALTAFKNRHTVKNSETFKAWILKIAANKCNDFYRKIAKQNEISFGEITENIVSKNHYGISNMQIVSDTIAHLGDKDKQVLFLYYFKNKPQNEIAKQLQIPVGTVKSRLYKAKKNFREAYPFPPKSKGASFMKTMPNYMPEYKIIPSTEKAFHVKWEEVMGWFLIPKQGEKITWAMYDFPQKNRTEIVQMEVLGKASIHGIAGVEISAIENSADKQVARMFIAQLTETHCRILAESHIENGIKKFFTFLDADEFLPNWGFGEDNCGKEIRVAPKGIITKVENAITCPADKEIMDVVGRYTVEINGKTYDTVCLIDVELYNAGVFSEQYIDENGKTVLWRRFNKNDWHFTRYNALWADKMPHNEKMCVNGETYVHWYDCITDYIL